jgi:hypothetical protein
MNTLLEKLFNTYHISPKNRHDIAQIYSLLPIDKKTNLINNFELLAYKLNKIEEGLNIERAILVPEAIDNIKLVLEQVKKERLKGI